MQQTSRCGARWGTKLRWLACDPTGTFLLLALLSVAILAMPGSQTFEGARYWLWAAWYVVLAWMTAQVVYIAYQDNFG